MRGWILTGALLWSLAQAAGADPVAMACHITGKPEVQTAGQSADKAAWKPLALMQKLEAGDKIRCGQGSEAIVVLYAGSQRFVVHPGTPAEVQANTIANAVSLGGLKGPSASVAQALSGGRVAAVLSRGPEAPRRLYPTFAGWLPANAREIQWGGEGWPEANSAKSYLFTIYNTNGIAVLTQRIETWQPVEKGRVAAAVPGLAELKPGHPYVWQLAPVAANGNIKSKDVHWGVLTLLAPPEADALQQQVKALEEQAAQTPNDPTLKVVLAEALRQKGLFMRALELLDDLNTRGEVGASGALQALYHELGPQAQLLAGRYEQLLAERPSERP